MKKLISLIFALQSFVLLVAQSNKNPEVRLLLRDGSSFVGTTKISNLIIANEFGKLEIPVKSVSRIELGIPSDDANKPKIINYIKQLSSSSEEMRKAAFDALSAMDVKAVPVIAAFLSSDDYKPSEFSDYTPELILNDLKAIYGLTDNISFNDVVFFDDNYVVGGSINNLNKIELSTTYGQLSIPKEKIKSIEILYLPGDTGNELTFILNASKNISSNQNGGWLKTGVMLHPGKTLLIKSSGQVILASLSNGKYNPDGVIKNSGSADDIPEDEYDGGGNYPKYGQVVYRIGETGQALKAGSVYKGVVKSSGMLYVSIYETVYNANNTGTYTVRISIK